MPTGDTCFMLSTFPRMVTEAHVTNRLFDDLGLTRKEIEVNKFNYMGTVKLSLFAFSRYEHGTFHTSPV